MSEQMVGADILEECGMNWLANALRTNTVPAWLTEWLANGPGKVYLVNSGEYSDYGVEAVFASRELANEYMNSYRNEHEDEDGYALNNFNELQECDINAGYSSGLFMFGVWMELDGTTREVRKTNDSFPSARIFDTDRWSAEHVRVSCWAKDETHAVKIANEKRIVLLHERDLEQRPW